MNETDRLAAAFVLAALIITEEFRVAIRNDRPPWAQLAEHCHDIAQAFAKDRAKRAPIQ